MQQVTKLIKNTHFLELIHHLLQSNGRVYRKPFFKVFCVDLGPLGGEAGSSSDRKVGGTVGVV